MSRRVQCLQNVRSTSDPNTLVLERGEIAHILGGFVKQIADDASFALEHAPSQFHASPRPLAAASARRRGQDGDK